MTKGDVMVFALMINLTESCDITKYEDLSITNAKLGVKKDDVFHRFVSVIFFRLDKSVMVVGVSIPVMGPLGLDRKMLDALTEGTEAWVLPYSV